MTLSSFFGMRLPAPRFVESEFESFREQLESADELPDAFFFSSDYLAFSLLPLLNEAEICKEDKLPRIIGFDNLVGRFPSPYNFFLH